MSKLGIAQLVLWFLAPALQLVIAAVMVRRKLYRTLPLFFCYTVLSIVEVPFGVAAKNMSYFVYFFFYWITEGIEELLAFAVIQEVFNNVFREHEGLRGFGTVLFRWAALVLLALSVGVALSVPGTDADRFIAGLVALDRSVSIVQAGLIVLLFLFCRFFGLNWRTTVFGVALGFGAQAIISAASAALRAQVGVHANIVYSLLAQISFNIAVAIWFVYFLMPSREVQRVQLPDSAQLKAWNRALQDLLRT
jgi:hypothetical protein